MPPPPSTWRSTAVIATDCLIWGAGASHDQPDVPVPNEVLVLVAVPVATDASTQAIPRSRHCQVVLPILAVRRRCLRRPSRGSFGPVAPTGVSTGVIEEGAIHDVGNGREQ